MKTKNMLFKILLFIFNSLLTVYSPAQQIATSKIAAGVAHSITVCSDGTAMAWGYNEFGQLGDGTIDNTPPWGKSSPVQVSGLTGTIAITGGRYHSLALKNDGTVWAWGRNSEGQLGDGTTMNRTSPVQVNGLTGIIAIAAGAGHSLALKNDGTVWAWGWYAYDQIGYLDDTFKGTSWIFYLVALSSNTPVMVSGLTDIIAIACRGYHSLALKNDGTVWAWGLNWYGQLGDGTKSTTYPYCKATPVQVSGLTGIIAITSGKYYSLALKNDGTIWAWGLNNKGQLGDSTIINRTTPVLVSGLTGIISIEGGEYHSLALKNDGTVWAWGFNYSGQLGDGTISTTPPYGKTIPIQVSGLTDVISIAGGGYHSLALKNDKTVYSWGWNSYFSLGDGTNIDRTTPVQVIGHCNITACNLLATIGSNSPVCEGDTLNLTSSGGISYLWSGPNSFSSISQYPNINNVTTAATGIYSVTVTDANGCTDSSSTNVIINSSPFVNAGNDNFVLFNSTNGVSPKPCVNLSGSVSDATSFSWSSSPGSFSSTSLSPTVCPVVNTTYTLTAIKVYSDNICITSDNVIIIALDLGNGTLPTVGNNPNKIYVCHSGTTLEVNGNANCSSVNSLCEHLNHGDALGVCGSAKMAGNEQVQSINKNIIFEQLTKDDIISKISFDIFPNPFSNSTNLSVSLPATKAVELEIYNIVGDLVAILYNGALESRKNYSLKLDRSILPSHGVYLCKLNTFGKVYYKKIIMMEQK